MADPRVESAVANWAPRFVAQGVDYNDFVRTTARVERWADWLPAWSATGDEHAALAREAEAAGRRLTAGEAWVRAALCYHFAKFVWFEDEEAHEGAQRRSIAALAAAHRLLDPTAERIEALGGAAPAIGNLRRPPGRARPPLVLLFPGLDSTKEEFFHWENVFLARGMATLSVDGPGQGEVGALAPIRHDAEAAIGAILDALAGRDDVDLDRVAAAGVSLGGYLAPRAAAFEPRLRAVAAIGGPYDFGACWPGLPPLTRAAFVRHSRAADDDEGRALAGRLDLHGVAARVEQPLLVVFGKLDRLIPWEQAERVAAEAPRSTLVMYEDGNHVCNNVPFRYRPLVGDWMAERLGANAGTAGVE